MRAALAKKLRRTVERNMPLNLSTESRYVPKAGTGRVRFAMVPELQANGTTQLVKVEVPTVTFRLAPDCTRYFTQRYKREFIKQRRQHA